MAKFQISAPLWRILKISRFRARRHSKVYRNFPEMCQNGVFVHPLGKWLSSSEDPKFGPEIGKIPEILGFWGVSGDGSHFPRRCQKTRFWPRFSGFGAGIWRILGPLGMKAIFPESVKKCDFGRFRRFPEIRGGPEKKWAKCKGACTNLTRKPVYQERGIPGFSARAGVVEKKFRANFAEFRRARAEFRISRARADFAEFRGFRGFRGFLARARGFRGFRGFRSFARAHAFRGIRGIRGFRGFREFAEFAEFTKYTEFAGLCVVTLLAQFS